MSISWPRSARSRTGRIRGRKCSSRTRTICRVARATMGAIDAAAALEIAVDLAAIRAAHDRIRQHIHRTPVLTSRSLDAAAGAALFFKCENLQKVGAFKARGACNAVFSLGEAEAARGVVTHSSGNHGAAVAWAAGRRGIRAWVVMPENSAQVKKAAVEGLGATVRFCAPTLEARDSTCAA